MPHTIKRSSWIVFHLSLAAYLPLLIGGWLHHSEINVACYSLWIILALMLTYSSKAQKLSGWKMPLAFCFGNIIMVVFALIQGGYTFNLGPTEIIIFYGIVTTLCVWVSVGMATEKWNPNILYFGGIFADVLSFYPQLKQYLLPHERPTVWMIIGWALFGLGSILNVFFVEHLQKKLLLCQADYTSIYGKEKNLLKIFEESAFSIENTVLISITILVMCR